MSDELNQRTPARSRRSGRLSTHRPALHAQPFSWPVRVYYEDTDSAGVVYYANYLKFIERARTEWLRAAGFEQHDIAAQYQAVFVVRAVAIEYLKPALFNDSLQATVEVAKVGNSQIVLVQRVLREGEALATAEVRVVCVNAATFRPVRIPKAIIAKIGTTS